MTRRGISFICNLKDSLPWSSPYYVTQILLDIEPVRGKKVLLVKVCEGVS